MWNNFLPAPLAGYFYTGTGSLFPILPWAGYVIAGGILGSYLAKHPNVFKTLKFSLVLAAIGAAFIIASMIGDFISNLLNIRVFVSQSSPNIILFRIGFVLILNALVSYFALRFENIPKFLIMVGRNTLLIYVVHLVILYGSAWTPGISRLWGKNLNGWESFFAAIVMITLMTIMVIYFNKLKFRNKQLVT